MRDTLTNAVTGNARSGGYGETYDYHPATGNLATKAGSSYAYGDPAHAHAVTGVGNDLYTYDANGNMLTRRVSNKTITFTYDAEGHLLTASGTGLTASFVYDGDGARVKSTINGVTTTFIGNTYEKTGSTVTKYYFAGGQRVAMRTGSTLYYLLGDHLGSTAITTSSTGAKVAELRYKAWGEVRYTSGTTPTKYQFTGQYSNAADFGLLFYNARWVDPSLGRFAQADTIVPPGVQGYDHYAYANNNPLKYTDPTGHCPEEEIACRVRLYSTLPLLRQGQSPASFFVANMGLPTNGGNVDVRYGHQNTLDGGADQDIGTKITKEQYLNEWGVHAAVDISGPVSDDIYSVYPGVVVWTSISTEDGGNKILIEHNVGGTRFYSVYMHLKSLEVNVGDSVWQGTTIGVMGDTGSENYTHLHFEVRTEAGVAHDQGNVVFPLGAPSWWANTKDELHERWVDISSQFGGYDDFLPRDWR